MDYLISQIKNKISSKINKFSEIIIEVLFSSGHLSYTVLADGVSTDIILGPKITLEISKFVEPNIKESINKLILTINDIKESVKFDFSEDYYISTKQELLFTTLEKTKGEEDIGKHELRELLEIAKHAINKVNLNEVLTNKCKLYLTIKNLQLVTDIPPNFKLNKNKVLLLCEITLKDIERDNLQDVVLRKIDEFYK